MIEMDEIFSDSDKRVAIWCDEVADTNDLALMCENIINNDVHLISVPAEMVPNVWTYLEKRNVKIFTRFDADKFCHVDMPLVLRARVQPKFLDLAPPGVRLLCLFRR